MLQELRNNLQGFFGKVIVALIVTVMGLFGFGAFTGFISSDNPVAVVNGEQIGEALLQSEVERRRRQIAAQEDSEESLEATQSPQFSAGVLENLIQDNVLRQVASERWVVTENMLDNAIRDTPDFQFDGQYDADVFRQALAGSGTTPLSYRTNLRRYVLLTQIRLGIIATDFATDFEFDRALSLLRQTRDISWLVIETDSLKEEVTLAEEDIDTHYEAHQAAYEIPEQVTVDYVELRQSDLAAQADVTEDEIGAAYDAEKADFTPEDQRRASHILLDITDERDAEQASEQLREFKAQVESGEADFAELAKEHSTDKGSGSKGGELGMSGRGAFVPPFENALWELEVDEISEPVTSQFGVHLIKLLEIGQSVFPEYEEIKNRLETEIRERKATDEFIKDKAKLAEISYESSDLVAVSETLDLPVKTSEPFGRAGTEEGLTADEGFIESAFSVDVLEQAYNSPVLDLKNEENAVVVLRLRERTDARLLSLEEAKPQIEDNLRSEEALKNAWLLADAAKVRLDEGDDKSTVASDLELTWEENAEAVRNQYQVPEEVIKRAFAVRPSDKVVVETIEVSDGVALLLVAGVTPGDNEAAPEFMIKRERETLKRIKGYSSLRTFQASLVAKADIDRRDDISSP